MEEAAFNIDDAVVIKNENLFLVAPRDARLPVEGRHPFGLYYNDCRFLSGWELTVLGHAPRPLLSTDTRGTAATHELTNYALSTSGNGRLPPQALQIRIERELVSGEILRWAKAV